MIDNFKKNYNFKKYMYFFAYMIPFFILLFIFLTKEVFPFGNSHILKVDAFHSYAPRLNELAEKIKNGGSLLYSWKGGLGNDFYLTFVTSMLNPALFLSLFFNGDTITELFSVLYLFQIPLGAVTFLFFLNEKFKKINFVSLAFSTAYALSSFVTATIFVYYWEPGIIILPLVAVGIERIVKAKKYTLYSLSLGFGILSNYMIGFFLCGFSVVYYFILILSNEKKGVFLTTVLTYIKASLLAGGIAAIAIIPAVISLGSTTYSNSLTSSLVNYNINFSISQFLTANYASMTPSVLQGGYAVPNIYVGLFSFLLVPFYYFNNIYKMKEKILYTIFYIILFLGFNVVSLYYIFHGMHFPSGLPHRFAFIYSFITLLLAYKAVINIKNIKIKYAVVILISEILLLTVLKYLFPQVKLDMPGFISDYVYKINFILIASYFSVLFIYLYAGNNKNLTSIIAVMIVIVAVTEIGITTNKNLNMNNGDERRDKYEIFLGSSMKDIKEITLSDNDFFRSELLPNRTFGDGKLFGYNGISIFSITYDSIIEMMKNLGITASTNKIEYRFATPLINSIFSVKYSYNREKMLNYPPSFFEEYKTVDDIVIYKNTKSLPIGFIVNDNINKWNENITLNSFENQNLLVNMMTNDSKKLFDEPIVFKNTDSTFLNDVYSEDGVLFNYSYNTIENEQRPELTVKYLVPESKYTYLNIRDNNVSRYQILVNDGKTLDITKNIIGRDTVDLGYISRGSEVTVKLTLKNALEKRKILDEEAYDDKKIINESFSIFFGVNPKTKISSQQNGNVSLYLCQMDENVYLSTIKQLSDQKLQVEYYDDTTIRGNISVKNEGMLFTSIPYDKRWHVYVNGKERSTKIIMDALIGVPLAEGEFNIEFRYKAKGIVLSIIISSITLVFITCSNIKKRREASKVKVTNDKEI